MGKEARTLFPELERKLDTRDLIGLKVVQVITDLHDTVRAIQLVDEKEEMHEITFFPVDSSYIAVKLDNHEVVNIETEV